MEQANEYKTNWEEGNEVSENLKRIAEKRTDIFGEEELTEIGRGVGETRKKKVDTSWDGTVKEANGNEPLKITPKPSDKPKEHPSHPKPPPPHHVMYPPHGVHPPGMGPPPPGFLPPGFIPPPGHRMGPPGMMPPGMAPPGFPMGPPMMRPIGDRGDGEPPIKKAKIDGKLESEKDWIEKHPGVLIIMIQIPNMPEKSSWNMHGQIERIQVVMSDKIISLKEKISEKLGGMPANKQKLKSDGGFWKDNKTLGYYNATNGMVLELGIKERGGKKK